jgi:ABC-type nitrate/sulfonate/bicarbonate transport system permease component
MITAQGAIPAEERPFPWSALVYLRTMAAFALVWHLVALWTDNPLLLPTPLSVAAAFAGLALEGELAAEAALSMSRLFAALVLAVAIAAPLGLLMGMSRRLEDYIDPLVELLRPISGIAWIPLGLFIFGVGQSLPIFIMAYTATFPILLGTVSGVKTIDRTLIRAAETMGLSRASVIVRVVLPATLPAILVSVRLGVASAWTAVIAAELVGAPNGLGYAISWYREMLVTPKMIAFIAMVGVAGYLTDLALRALTVRLTPWAPGAEGRR